MTLDKKIELLKALNEDELRSKLLVPLFTKMGFIDPIIHHHNNEKGKDIVLKEFDSKFKNTRYIAVVVKAGDVNGSASGSSSYFTLINQIKQAINEPYKHIYDLKEVVIDQIIIVISGRFLATSLESVYGTLKQDKLDKIIREPVDINRLPNLVDEYFPEYWKEYENEHDSLMEQRNNLLNNLGKLGKILFTENKEQERFLNAISNMDFDINLLPYKSLTRYIANIGYKGIDIDEIDDFYTDPNISNYYCNIKEYTFDIKEKVKNILYDIDEVVEILKSILNEKDPKKIIDLSYELDSHLSGVGHRLQFSTRDIENQDEFYYAIRSYTEKKNLLIESGLYDFYQSLYDTISTSTIDQLIKLYKGSTPYTNTWLRMMIELNLENKELEQLKYDIFEKMPEITETDNFFGHISKEYERVSRIEKEKIIVEIAIDSPKQEENIEKKAKKFVWLFERGFEKMFFEMLGYIIS